MPSIDHSYPVTDNLKSFKNLADLLQNNKFPTLFDSDLHIIVGIREAGLINYDKIREPCSPGEPFVGRCKIGWAVFGSDPYLKTSLLPVVILFAFRTKYLKKKLTPCCMNHLLSAHTILTMPCRLMIRLSLRNITAADNCYRN